MALVEIVGDRGGSPDESRTKVPSEGDFGPFIAAQWLRTVELVNVSRISSISTARVIGMSLLLVASAVGCAADVADGPTTTTTAAPASTVAPETTVAVPVAEPFDIVGTALSAGVFTQLAGMLVDAGLVDTLRGAGPFTVFAPTDAAFQALPLDALHAVQADPDTLATVLTYHVVPGALKVADLHDGPLTTVSGLDLTVSHSGDTVLINGVPIASPDVVASNGIIQIMGQVLLPPS
ncbi:MAG: cell surface lipoprotein [Ilumatobacteraceae bacterium]|nr:cell surface lipoprotein [Ilumatobacteraceae bacterium]